MTHARPCVRCGERPEHISKTGRRRSWCSPCLNKSNRETKAKNPVKYHDQRRSRHLLLKYGLTLEGYERLVAEQNGVCAICRRPPRTRERLAIDHDHETGAVRALLCDPCNQALGMCCDDPEILRSAADYVERFRSSLVLTRRDHA